MTNNDDKQRKAELSRRIKDACHLEGADKFRAINQAYAELGLPVLMADDWAAVDAMVDQIDTLAQTRNHDLRRLAGKTVDEYRWHLRNDGHLTDDAAVAGPYALLGFDPRKAFDLTEHTIEELAAKYLDKHHRCDVGGVHDRAIFAGKAEHVIKAIYGESTCLYKCCTDCLVWLNGLGDAQECLDFSLTNPVEASVYSTHVAT